MNLEDAFNKLKLERNQKQEATGLIKGTCTEFCPTYEQMDRQIRRDINKFEIVLIKKYQRSAAGKTKSFPEDIRPINVLTDTVDHLFSFLNPTKGSFMFKDLKDSFVNLYCKENQIFLHDLYKFIEDRIRAVRLDLTVQSLSCDNTILLIERITRFYIIFNHILYDYRAFELHLNCDQLKKSLMDLVSLYDQRGYHNEEFSNYGILSNISDAENCYKWKSMVGSSIDEIMIAYAQNNIVKFTRLIKGLDYLQLCSVLPSIQKIIQCIIVGMKKAIIGTVSIEELGNLCILNESEVLLILEKEGVRVAEYLAVFDRGNYKTRELFISRHLNLYLDSRRINTVETLIRNGSTDRFLYNIIIYEFIRGKIDERMPHTEIKTGGDGFINDSKPLEQEFIFNRVNNENSADTNISNTMAPKGIDYNTVQDASLYNKCGITLNQGCKDNAMITTDQELMREMSKKRNGNKKTAVTIKSGNIKNNGNIESPGLNQLFDASRRFLLLEFSKRYVYRYFQKGILLRYAKDKILDWMLLASGKKNILFVTESPTMDCSLLYIQCADNTQLPLCDAQSQHFDFSAYNFMFFIVKDENLRRIILQKYSMYNVFVGDYESAELKCKSTEFVHELSGMKRIQSGMLFKLVTGKSRNEVVDFLWMLTQNKRNTAIIERNLLNFKNYMRMVDCKIYYEIEDS